MSPIVVDAGFAAIALVLALRLPIAVRNRPAALMWMTIAFGTAGVSTGTEPGHARMLKVAGPTLTLLAQTLSITIALIFLVSLIRHLHGRPLAPRGLVGVYGLVAVLVLLPVATRSTWTSPLPFEAAALGAVPVPAPWVAHRLGMYALDIVAMTYAATFCARYARASRGALSLGLRLITAGCALALAFALASVVVIAAATTGTGAERGVLALVPAVLPLLAGGSIAAIVAGYGAEPVSRAVSTAAAWRQLRPLWRDLVCVAPDIAMPGQHSWFRGALRLTLQDRLYRRVMEIKDGILLVRENLPAHYLDAVVGQAMVATSSLARARVIAEASWLTQAVANRRNDVQYGASAAPLTRGSMTFEEEVLWLRQLSVAYQQEKHETHRSALLEASA